MSTDWGYACVSHDPPMYSEEWFNHGEAVLRAALLQHRSAEGWPDDPDQSEENRRLLGPDPAPVQHEGYATTAPVRWLNQHPHCEVVIVSEYGEAIDSHGVQIAGHQPVRSGRNVGGIFRWADEPWPPEGEHLCACEAPVSMAPWNPRGSTTSWTHWTRCAICKGLIRS